VPRSCRKNIHVARFGDLGERWIVDSTLIQFGKTCGALLNFPSYPLQKIQKVREVGAVSSPSFFDIISNAVGHPLSTASHVHDDIDPK